MSTKKKAVRWSEHECKIMAENLERYMRQNPGMSMLEVANLWQGIWMPLNRQRPLNRIRDLDRVIPYIHQIQQAKLRTVPKPKRKDPNDALVDTITVALVKAATPVLKDIFKQTLKESLRTLIANEPLQ